MSLLCARPTEVPALTPLQYCTFFSGKNYLKLE